MTIHLCFFFTDKLLARNVRTDIPCLDGRATSFLPCFFLSFLPTPYAYYSRYTSVGRLRAKSIAATSFPSLRCLSLSLLRRRALLESDADDASSLLLLLLLLLFLHFVPNGEREEERGEARRQMTIGPSFFLAEGRLVEDQPRAHWKQRKKTENPHHTATRREEEEDGQ